MHRAWFRPFSSLCREAGFGPDRGGWGGRAWPGCLLRCPPGLPSRLSSADPLRLGTAAPGGSAGSCGVEQTATEGQRTSGSEENWDFGALSRPLSPSPGCGSRKPGRQRLIDWLCRSCVAPPFRAPRLSFGTAPSQPLPGNPRQSASGASNSSCQDMWPPGGSVSLCVKWG